MGNKIRMCQRLWPADPTARNVYKRILSANQSVDWCYSCHSGTWGLVAVTRSKWSTNSQSERCRQARDGHQAMRSYLACAPPAALASCAAVLETGPLPPQDHKSGTICRPISDYVGCHTASLGAYWRHFYSDSKATAQCELLLTALNRNILTYLLTSCHNLFCYENEAILFAAFLDCIIFSICFRKILIPF